MATIAEAYDAEDAIEAMWIGEKAFMDARVAERAARQAENSDRAAVSQGHAYVTAT